MLYPGPVAVGPAPPWDVVNVVVVFSPTLGVQTGYEAGYEAGDEDEDGYTGYVVTLMGTVSVVTYADEEEVVTVYTVVEQTVDVVRLT